MSATDQRFRPIHPRRLATVAGIARDLGRALAGSCLLLCVWLSPKAACAITFSVEDVPPSPVRLGIGLSIAVDGAGNPSLVYSRDLDINGSYRHAFKQGGVWHYTTIVDRASAYSSLAYNGGSLFASYQDAPNTELRFARFNGTGWTTEPVSHIFPIEGEYTSLAFDHLGGPHIGYHEDSGADNANHAFMSGGWVPEVADGFGTNALEGLQTSIALSSLDTIFISHIGTGLGGLRLRLAELSGPAWTATDVTETITPDQSSRTSIVVTPVGQPEIAFVGSTAGAQGVIYLARRVTPASWSIVPLDTLGSNGTDLALRLDSVGRAHVIYTKQGALWHAVFDSLEGLQREIVAPSMLGELDLAIGAGDVLHIGYVAGIVEPTATVNQVRYAHGTFGSWTIEPVEGNEDEGQFLALTTTPGGAPVAAFYHASVSAAQITRRNGLNDWSTDDVAEGGNVGRLVSLKPGTVSPNAGSMAYFDAGRGEILIQSGTYDAWEPTGVIESGFAVASLSFADSSGWDRVAYYDSLAGNLYLARIGPGGETVELVDDVGDVGRSCSLGITTDGVTHIVYFDATGNRLRHARLTNTGWAFLTIASGPGVGQRCSLATKGRSAGVAYYDAGGGNLNWARWDNGAWTTGPVDVAGDVGKACAVALDYASDIDIAYYDATNNNLKFARVSETLGGTIVTAVTVDPQGGVGSVTGIAIEPSSALAEIVYYNASLGKMRYAKEIKTADVAGAANERMTNWLRVSPNPAYDGGEVQVSSALQRVSSGDVAVYDVLGRVVVALKRVTLGGDAAPIRFTVPGTLSGVVFVSVTLEGGSTATRRAVMVR